MVNKLKCIESNNEFYTVGEEYPIRSRDGDGYFMVTCNDGDWWYVDGKELFCHIPEHSPTNHGEYLTSRFEVVDD